ncbi:MAG: hypothetical protein HIU86_14080 [Acidobacteria bacterium]|nr:hypothetical protein [Acidobacteriota bacterium]
MLLLRALVAAGRLGTAAHRLATCERTFRRTGVPLSPALRAAAAPQAWALVLLASTSDSRALDRARPAARGVDSAALIRRLALSRSRDR